tara:strand:- start:915 stop:1793 length:879 start_codon:yes stop_codon:yes gene_type:complete
MATTDVNTDLLTSIAAGNNLQSQYSVAGRSTVLIGATTADYESVNGSVMFAVGATDGTVSMGNNQEVVKLQSSAMVNPYAVIPTAYDFQVSLTLQEVDIPNIGIALSLGSAESDITTTVASAQAGAAGTNAYLTQMTNTAAFNNSTTVTQNAHGLVANDVVRLFINATDETRTVASVTDANTWVADSTLTQNETVAVGYKHGFDNYYDIDPANPSGLFSMRIITLAPQATEGTVAYFAWDFYKVKIVSQGTIDFDRTTAVTIPITAHCLGNDSDVVGRLWHTDTLTYRGYPS